MYGYQIPSVTGKQELSGRRYEVICCSCERDAWRMAREATLAGMLEVEVVLRPARAGQVWGYAFTARTPSATWVIEGPNGEWLSEERAANSVEALALYHATGGTNGFFARQISHGAGTAAGNGPADHAVP